MTPQVAATLRSIMGAVTGAQAAQRVGVCSVKRRAINTGGKTGTAQKHRAAL